MIRNPFRVALGFIISPTVQIYSLGVEHSDRSSYCYSSFIIRHWTNEMKMHTLAKMITLVKSFNSVCCDFLQDIIFNKFSSSSCGEIFFYVVAILFCVQRDKRTLVSLTTVSFRAGTGPGPSP